MVFFIFFFVEILIFVGVLFESDGVVVIVDVGFVIVFDNLESNFDNSEGLLFIGVNVV